MRIILTKHAIQRAKECRLTIAEAVNLFNKSDEEKIADEIYEYKNSKYSNNGVGYYRNGPYIFVARLVKDNFGNWIILIITMSERQDRKEEKYG